METERQELVDLHWEWDQIAEELKEVPGIDLDKLKRFFEEGPGKLGKHFFVVQYKPGTVIMAKGATSDYAAVHLSGLLRVRETDVQQTSSSRNCWDQPRIRRLESIVLDRVARADFEANRARWFDSWLAGIYLRFPGIPLWLVDLTRRRLPWWGGDQRSGDQRAERLEQHLARVLRDRIPKIRRGERDLARPVPEGEVAKNPRGGHDRRATNPKAEGKLDEPQVSGSAADPTVNASTKPDKVIRVYDANDPEKNRLHVTNRFMEIASTLWHQPRSESLLADDDPDDPVESNAPCRMLLIKRKALQEILGIKPRKSNPAAESKTAATGTSVPEGKATPSTKPAPEVEPAGVHKPGHEFLNQKLAEFVTNGLPGILANNRLFRDMIYVTDVLDWNALRDCLRGALKGSTLEVSTLEDSDETAGLRRHIAGLVDKEFKQWLDSRTSGIQTGVDKTQMVSSLNKLMAHGNPLPDGITEQVFHEEVREEVKRLLERRAELTKCESFRFNRLLLEAASRQAIRGGRRPWPLFLEDFQTFAQDLAKAHLQQHGVPLQPKDYEKHDKPIYEAGDEADTFYLILSGMVRVQRGLAGGEVVANNLESGGFFGERALVDSNESVPQGAGQPEPLPRHTASVKALCRSYLLPIDRGVFKQLPRAKYDWLNEKLRHERQRVARRDKNLDEGWVLPPREPPPEIADRLVLTRNILLIDMDRCTRCDQCVRGCAAAHDDQPRFHRANPDLRFGKWEVAGACMNCDDAPCLEACPVGAITFLDKAVQIHRTRCIGCTLCSKACPFGVIDMYAPTSPPDAPSLSRNKPSVASKCDLCLTEKHDPPCVAWCPYDAAIRVDPAQFFRGLKGRIVYADGPAGERSLQANCES